MDYPYTVGIIRSIEEKLFAKPQFEKLAKTEVNDFFKTLQSLGFGATEQGQSVETILTNELSRIKEFLDSVSPNKTETDLFFLSQDILQIKYWFKQRLFGGSAAKDVHAPGSLKEAVIKKAVFEQNYEGLTPLQKRLFENIELAIKPLTQPRVISATIDRLVFVSAFSQLGPSGSPILKTYFRLKIDTTNLISLLRAKSLGWSQEMMADMLIPEGLIDLPKLKDLYSQNVNDIARELSSYYEEKLTLALKSFAANQNWRQLDVAFEQLIMMSMKAYNDDSFSIGPILYYYLLKLDEINAIRQIYYERLQASLESRWTYEFKTAFSAPWLVAEYLII